MLKEQLLKFYLLEYELNVLCFGINSWQALESINKYNNVKKQGE